MTRSDPSRDLPQGFTEAEWEQALKSGRATEVDRPAPRRGPKVLRPLSACAWFLRLWLRPQPGQPGHGQERCDDG